VVIFKNLFGASQQSEIMTTALDLANTAVSLASNPAAIEPLARELHSIANRLPPGALLSARDEAAIFAIYLKLEEYLATADPLRTFDKTELRNKASRGLRTRLEAYERENKISA
jgi:hypothetical protein